MPPTKRRARRGFCLAAAILSFCAFPERALKLHAAPCQLRVEAVEFSDKKLEWFIFNPTGVDAVLTGVFIEWPQENGVLKKVKREGDTVYDVVELPPSATVSDGAFTASASKRSFENGKSKKLVFEFEHRASTDLYDYVIWAEFDSECMLEIAGSVNAACNWSRSSLFFDGKKLKTTLTNQSSTLALVTGIFVAWPSANGKLKAVKADDDAFYDVDEDPPSFSTQTGFHEDPARRILFPGQTVELMFEFDDDAEEDAGDYSFRLEFGSACAVAFPDEDADGVFDADDNCPTVGNPTQGDGDGDGLGDACDVCREDAANDLDRDGVCGDLDNCPAVANLQQTDADGDGVGDACDRCPADAFDDVDRDGVCGDADNCPSTANAEQSDADGDSLGDACDECPADAANDADGDGVCGDVDNCVEERNGSQSDADGDGVGDVCDECPGDAANDADGDGVCGSFDNCAGVANGTQSDADGDGLGDACDECPADAANDADGDGVCGDVDNCVEKRNGSQSDADGDGVGDVCDECPGDAANDADGDGVCGSFDNCAGVANGSQSDADGDGLGDACDECPGDAANDADGDGVCGDVDNCVEKPNGSQLDADRDGLGDVCDPCPYDERNRVDDDGVCEDETGSEPDIEFVLEGESGVPGGVVDVSFEVRSAECFISMVCCSVEYDPEALVFLGPILTPEIRAMVESRPEETQFEWAEDPDEGWFQMWLVLDYRGRETYSLTPQEANGVASFRFQVPEDAPEGRVSLSFTRPATADYEGVFDSSDLAWHVYNGRRCAGEDIRPELQFEVEDVDPRRLFDSGVVIRDLIGEVGIFVRGDANLDLEVDLADPVMVLDAVFGRGSELGCPETADANVDGAVDLSDPMLILWRLFTPSMFSQPALIDPADIRLRGRDCP